MHACRRPSAENILKSLGRKEIEMKNGNKAQNKTTAGGIFSYWKPLLLALVIYTALLVLGGELLPKREVSLYRNLWFCDVALIALSYLANFLFLRRLDQRLNKRKLSEIHAELLQKQQDVEADQQQAALRLLRCFRFARFWYALMLLLVCLAALLIIPASLPVVVSLLTVWILWGLLCIWFRQDGDVPPTLLMTEADYPVICSLVRQAAETAGCTLPVRVYAGGESVGILRRPKEIRILMDAVTCALYTKQELYNVLLHEFAHEFNEDTVQSMRLGRERDLWNNLPADIMPGIGGYLLNLPAARITLENIYYDLFASKHKEELADACAARWGDPQALVNALAKLSVWSFFENDTPVPELQWYSEYAAETPPEDLPSRALAAFHRKLPEKREEWRRRLDIELPPRVRTHPIFRERREAFGVAGYSFEDTETDPAYLAETEAMLAMTGKAIAESMAEDYEEKRKTVYLERKDRIERAKAVTDWSACSLDERIEMAKALAVLEPELEETVIQSIRRDEPENAYGCMLLGSKRCRENDPACVELLFRAAAGNDNFVESAYEMIGDFALRNGDQALLDRYRAEVAEAVQGVRDSSDSMALHWNDRDSLSENDLPTGLFDANREAILERTEGKLARLYTVKKPFSDGFCYYYFLEFPKELDREERARLYHQVFLYLDYLEDQYYLDDLTDRPKQRDFLLKKIPRCEIFPGRSGI